MKQHIASQLKRMYHFCAGQGRHLIIWMVLGRCARGSTMQKTRTAIQVAATCLAAFFCTALGAQDKSDATDKPSEIAQILGGERQGPTFGPYKWQTLGVHGRWALMMNEDIAAISTFRKTITDVIWDESGLRKYLNGDFLKKIAPGQQKMTARTIDKAFLPSFTEANRVFHCHDLSAIAGGSWWRVSSVFGGGFGAYVLFDGNMCANGVIVYDTHTAGPLLGSQMTGAIYGFGPHW
jgi:hypothetical protein